LDFKQLIRDIDKFINHEKKEVSKMTDSTYVEDEDEEKVEADKKNN